MNSLWFNWRYVTLKNLRAARPDSITFTIMSLIVIMSSFCDSHVPAYAVWNSIISREWTTCFLPDIKSQIQLRRTREIFPPTSPSSLLPLLRNQGSSRKILDNKRSGIEMKKSIFHLVEILNTTLYQAVVFLLTFFVLGSLSFSAWNSSRHKTQTHYIKYKVSGNYILDRWLKYWGRTRNLS